MHGGDGMFFYVQKRGERKKIFVRLFFSNRHGPLPYIKGNLYAIVVYQTDRIRANSGGITYWIALNSTCQGARPGYGIFLKT